MRRSRVAWLVLPLTVATFVLLVWPLCVLAYGSWHHAGSADGSSYVRLWHDSAYRTALLHSLVLSAAVAAASTLLSLGPAWLLARHSFPGKRFVRAAFALPASLSGIMVGFLAVIMLGRVGVVPQATGRWFGAPWLSGAAYQMTGLIIAYLYFEIPRGVLALEASLARFDPQWIEAAASLGAGAAQRFRWVLLPLLRPALVSAFALTFSVSLGSFGVALILSRRFSVLPLEIFYRFTGLSDAPLAAAMAVSLTAVALVVQYALRERSVR
ncbi:MAG: ABC transporter permease subunit [Gluconacetobacter diazotrophicus]|nr:ABC transporter permease subunit [Gluconacetobacter diazotrophicus]